ncbi:ABC transporter ATP-binding protein [Phascolarctobacterium faecium]|jgi:ABC-type multidrug transport system fused ATPase/permease subunit|uniref:ABC transporter ATP-binding protein n=2 Tax=Phascolarctobacterium faecium TaxID=33025 RepID=UPI002673B50C|nr:ABC transporter ATP-binding protein [Phascolarctobacterium faecium]
MDIILKIYSILNLKQIRRCSIIIVAMILGAILEAIGIGAILPLISIMGNPDFLTVYPKVTKYAGIFGIMTHIQFIITATFLLLILYIIKNIYLAWQNKIQIDFAVQNQIYYSEELLTEYLQKPYLYHLNHNTATLLRNVNSGGVIVFSLIMVSMFTLLTEIITAVTIWLMLVMIDAFTAIIVAGFIGSLLYFIIKGFRKKITEQGKIQNEYSALYIKCINQSLGAIKETKVSCKEEFFLDAFRKAYFEYGKANGKFLFMNQLPRMLIETIIVCGLLLLIITKLMLGNQPEEIVPLLGVLALAAFRLMPSANRIVNLSNGIRFQMPLFNELYEDLLIIKNKGAKETETCLQKPESRMDFENVVSVEELSFAYPEIEKQVLNNISFSIPKGKFVGIVGPSGAGKTTFVDILLGLLAPSKGKISVDGKNIYDDIRTWQANLAYVPQSIYLIDGTIRENIALGVDEKEINDALINKVLQMAELYDFVQELPAGIDTTVGERGVKLSGGQRQRIGIARALYYQPQVLVLDEATSALDNETEKSITDTILKLKGQITIIAVAHRLTTLAQCDFKVKFENGKAFIIK